VRDRLARPRGQGHSATALTPPPIWPPCQPSKSPRPSWLLGFVRCANRAGSDPPGRRGPNLFVAFNLALRSEGDTEAPVAMITFAITSNPVAGIKAIPVRPCSRPWRWRSRPAGMTRVADTTFHPDRGRGPPVRAYTTHPACPLTLLRSGQRFHPPLTSGKVPPNPCPDPVPGRTAPPARWADVGQSYPRRRLTVPMD
jgi:hypothetical protein